MAINALFWFGLAVVFACLEIEMEGKYGWAEKMPTWYRAEGPAAKAFGLMASGKPLTGYHLFMLVMMLFVFHVPFASGTEWSLAAELTQMARYMLVITCEDFAWFVLNPHYGIRKFRKGAAWWFKKSVWVGGLFPLDYLMGLGASLLLSANSIVFGGSIAGLRAQLSIIGWSAAYTVLLVALAPAYHRWYARMRQHDERDLAGISHD